MKPSVGDARQASSFRRGIVTPLWTRILVLAILIAPSIWLLATVPPLWRDSDGYNQITGKLGEMTIVHFPPLYCFAARIPLYLGKLAECLRSGAELPGTGFFGAPHLTDSGIFSLVCAQHLLLQFSLWFFVRTLRAAAAAEIVVALLLAANASFYSFAHCVGSEAVSIAATIWLVALCLRIMRARIPTPLDWCWLGVSLAACILSRHINAVLVLILPCACVIAAAFRMLRGRFSARRDIVPWLRTATLATLVGVTSILFAKGAVRLLSHEFHVKIRSTVGFTFLWRLKFLALISDSDRAAFLAELQGKTADPFAQRLLTEIATAARGTDHAFDPALIHNAFYRAILETEQRGAALLLYASENKLAKTVLLSMPPAYRLAVRRDFAAGLAETPARLASAPFETTLYCFDRLQEFPALLDLETFRGAEARQRIMAARDGPYYRLMKFPFWAAMIACLALGLVGFRRGSRLSERLLSLSAALVFVALAMLVLNCALTEYLPRYTLPLWNLVFLAVLLQVRGAINGTTRWLRFSRA